MILFNSTQLSINFELTHTNFYDFIIINFFGQIVCYVITRTQSSHSFIYRHLVGVTSPHDEQFFMTGHMPQGICTSPGGANGEFTALYT